MDIQPILKELAKLGVTTLTQESIKLYINTRIKPIFENWGKEESRSVELEECISEYLLKCYTKNIIMNTIVFGRLQKTLDDLYISLTLEEYRNEDKKWIIDATCYDILDTYDRVLIIDKAGMGKSTIVKYFACQGINLDKCIPIVIELKALGINQSILDYIKEQLASFDRNIEIEDIIKMINKGEFVIFFDGYDEIANNNKPFVLYRIQEFVNNARHTKIMLTSREEDDLNSLGEFKCVNVKPLGKDEAYHLISKYDNYGEISKKLMKRLEEDTLLEVLHEFLTNPLLVSLLYKTFEYKEEIPYKKIDFYDQVYAALFNDHDKTKGSAYAHEKKTKLDKFQFEKVLRAFGFLSIKSGEVGYSSQKIYSLLEQSINRFGWLKVSASDFLDDIMLAVPFIQKDGNVYKWVHKSFMEYFASCFICYDNKELEQDYFRKMLFNQKYYYNILDFCYEIDTLSFRKYVIFQYVKQFVDWHDMYFADKFYSDYDQNYLRKAKYLLETTNDLTYSFCYVKNAEDKINNLRGEGCAYSISAIGEGKCIIIAGCNPNYKIYEIIHQRMPELFDIMDINEEMEVDIVDIIESFELETVYKFDDNIKNLINSSKDIFYQIVDIFFDILYPEYFILNYDKCKELLKEIETENNDYRSSLFEL